MIALLQELWELIQRLWNTGNRWIRTVLVIVIFVWPAIMIGASMMPWMWLKAGAALLPFLAIVLFLVAWVDPLVIGVIAAFRNGRRALRALVAIAAVEMIIGCYLMFVPVHNDRLLLPAVAVVAITLALMAAGNVRGRWAPLARKALFAAFVVLTGFFFLGGRRGGKAVFAKMTYDAPERYVPLAEKPPRGSRACQTLWPAEIPPSVALADSVYGVSRRGDTLVYRFRWTGERPFYPLRPLFGESLWPEGKSRIRLEVRHLGGHLDLDNRYDPAVGVYGGLTSGHSWVAVTKRRDYGRGTYCPGLERSYPYYQTLRNYWAPAQTAMVVDPQRPKEGFYPFTESVVTLEVTRGENPQMLLNVHAPPNGRMHAAEFSVTIVPVH